MGKEPFRPLRLLRADQSRETQPRQQAITGVQPIIAPAVDETPGSIPTTEPHTATAIPLENDTEATNLLKKTPKSYLFNQAYGLWVYISMFVLVLILTHGLSDQQYGAYAVAVTAYNTILYIIAFGFEDATYTFIPRVFADHGKAAAAHLIRRLLLLRVGVLVLTALIMLFGLHLLADLFATIPPLQGAARDLKNPELEAHLLPITIYVISSSVASLLTALCTGLMRMRLVFFIGSLTQAAILASGYIVLQLGWAVEGVLWILALTSVTQMMAFFLFLAPFLFSRGTQYHQPLLPLLKLGFNAWLTNLVSGALLKQVAITLLSVYAVSLTEIGYFNLAFQLADAANLLLVSGFGGVAGAALAAAFIGQNYQRLSRTWQTLIKIETLLAAPGLVFCLFNAPSIAHALYPDSFGPVGGLLAVFVFFNLIMRVLGTYIHQPTLYVVNRSSLAMISQWVGLGVVILTGVLCIGYFKLGAAGALIADGMGRIVTGSLMLLFLWRKLPQKYPVGFTLRFLLALALAAIPSILWVILWQPTDRFLLLGYLAATGSIFILLCAGLLLWLKPLEKADLETIQSAKPALVRYLRPFTRTTQEKQA